MINLVRFFVIFYMFYETYCRNNLDIPVHLDGAKAYLGLWRFLTYQNYQILTLTNALLFLGQFSSKCHYLGKRLLFGVSFATNCIVFSFFWAIWFLDRELIFPRALDPFYPMWMNLNEHFWILPIVLMNIFSLERPDFSKKSSFFWLFSYACFYGALLIHIHEKTGKWVYPFLRVMKFTHLVIFFPAVFAIAGVFHNLGFYLNAKANPEKKKTQ